MKMKQIFYVAGLLAMMAACTTDDQPESASGERVPIGLAYTTQPQVETRASASQTLNNDYIESGKTITVRISNYNAGAYTDYTYTTGASGALTLPTPAPYYPLDGTNVDILAYYPASASTSFTIQSDQTTDANYTASDLMWATPITNQAKTTSNVTLNFTHKMAKICANISAGTAVSEINSVKLKQVKPTVGFNLGDGTTDAASGDAGDVTIASGETAASVSGAAVIPAQTITGSLLEIGVTLTNGTTGTATYSVPSGKAFSANNVYTLNITVNWPEVGATTTIAGWSDNGSVTVNPTQCLTFNVGGVFFNMMAVKGGDYEMTMTDGTVTGSLSSYYMGQTQVTRALWRAVMGGDYHADGTALESQVPAVAAGDDNYPVARVTYLDICGGSYSIRSVAEVTADKTFLYKLNTALEDQLEAYGLSAMSFKLPTEAQWEYAAIGGQNAPTPHNTYVSTSDEDKIINYAWYSVNSSSATHPVGQKLPNELGLYDMNGNVWEWCQDWYNSTTNGGNHALGLDYCNSDESNAQGVSRSPYTDHDRVLRGGSWNYDASYCAVSCRGGNCPSFAYSHYGLRLVLQ